MAEAAASEAGIPSEIVAGLHHYQVAPALRSLIARVAVRRSLTAEPPGVGYVAVRPYAWGTVSAYFHRTYVDVAVSPELAEKLHRSHGWKLVKVNGTTGLIRIEADTLGSPEIEALATQTLLGAVDKSEAGSAYEGGKGGTAQPGKVADLCPLHGIERLGGRCDVCD